MTALLVINVYVELKPGMVVGIGAKLAYACALVYGLFFKARRRESGQTARVLSCPVWLLYLDAAKLTLF